jgi:hypothetical protein
MPSEFLSTLQTHAPEFYELLNSNHDLKTSVQHWQWRLFLSDQGDFRELLGLDPFPMHQITTPTPLLYSMNPGILNLIKQDGASTIPKYVNFCGPWDYYEKFKKFSKPSIPFVPQVIISFGSMDTTQQSLSLADSLHPVLSSLIETLTELQLSIVWVYSASTPLGKILEKLQSNNLKAIQGPTCYSDLILPSDDSTSPIFIHHGGLGTIQTAMKMEARQVVLPFTFDQGLWAERIEDSGLGMFFRKSHLLEQTDSTYKNIFESSRMEWERIFTFLNDFSPNAQKCKSMESNINMAAKIILNHDKQVNTI